MLSYNFHNTLRLFPLNSINQFVFVMKRSMFSVDELHALEGQYLIRESPDTINFLTELFDATVMLWT
jgi:hypothetical protein